MLQLKTERLLLREIQEEDWELFQRLSSDPTVRIWQSFLPGSSESECREWVRDFMFHNCQKPRFGYNFTIVLQPSGGEIGWIGFGHASDKEVGDREFGYALIPSHWRKGYTTEALAAVLSLAFSQRDANTIFGECNSLNVGSARGMQKCGMKLVRQWTERNEDEPSRESERYMIERSEWKAQNTPALGWDGE